MRKVAVVLACVVALGAQGGIDFDAGADLRVRQELIKNVPGLPNGGLLLRARRTGFIQHMRFRPRVWGEVKWTTQNWGSWRIYTRLTDEFRWCPEPKKHVHSFPDELIIDNLFVEGKGLFDGFLDLKGKEVIPCQYDEAGLFDQGRAYVSAGGKWGIIDRQGNIVLPIEYDNSGYRAEAYRYHDGLALVEKGRKYGYCDMEGRLVIYPCFDNAYQFSEGLAPVQLGAWGYIDTHGDFFIPLVFDMASPFQYGRSEVVYQGQVHKMNTDGQCVKNCKNAPKSWRN